MPLSEDFRYSAALVGGERRGGWGGASVFLSFRVPHHPSGPVPSVFNTSVSGPSNTAAIKAILERLPPCISFWAFDCIYQTLLHTTVHLTWKLTVLWQLHLCVQYTGLKRSIIILCVKAYQCRKPEIHINPYVNKPTTCWGPDYFVGSRQVYTNSYCWDSNTYSCPFRKKYREYIFPDKSDLITRVT